MSETQAEYMTREESQWDRLRERRDKSQDAMNLVLRRHTPKMRPNEKLHLAQVLINEVLNEGITYADFQSAQADTKYVTKARNALRGLSLT